MKKLTILFFTLSIWILSVEAQVAINTNGSNPDTSSILEVQSTNMGLLIPRMTNTQIQYINNPANGLLVYSTDDSKTYCFNSSDNEWKELAIGSNGITPLAVFTLGSYTAIANKGIYVGITILPNDVIVQIGGTVTVPGCWSITTSVINGYSFSGSGTFTTTGTFSFVLRANGTPIAAQTDHFTTGAGGGWSWDITVDPAPTYPSGTEHCITGGAEIQHAYNPVTGETWMDRNLGASQVATSSDDSDAYGDLYQWGRLSDGHQCRTSGTTTTLSSTNVPGHSNFITSSISPYDWRNPQNSDLWQGQYGVNNPCPSGYRIPTQAEWEAERLSWTQNNIQGAFDSPLKLTSALYRFVNGTISSENGGYWTSDRSTNYSYFLSLQVNNSYTTGQNERAYGYSVRCIKN